MLLFEEETENALDSGDDVLPEGWTAAPLRALADMRLGKMLDAAKQKDGTPRPYLRNINVRWGTFDLDDLQQIALTDEEAVEFALRPGDVLVCEGGEPGRCAIWERAKTNITFQKAIHRIRLNGAVDPKWLMYDLRRAALDGSLDEYFTGSTIKHLTGVSLARYPLRFPPLAEQKRIAAKVDAVLAKASAARQRLAKVPATLKRFRQSILAAACSGRLTEDWRGANSAADPPAALMSHVMAARAARSHGVKKTAHAVPEEAESAMSELPELPQSWSAVRCLELCQPERALTYGIIKLGPHVSDGVPVLRSSDVRHLRIDAADMKCVSPKIASEFQRTFLSGGEILVTVRGTLGGVAVTPPEMKGFNISREVAVVPIEPDFSAEFFAIAIGSKHSQNWLAEVEKGVAYTGINIEDLKRLPLPLPPLPEQHEIVHRVSALFALAEKVEARLAAATAAVERVTRAVLSKAFRGELVETEASLARREGRNYESAAALLERVQAAHAANAPTAKAKRRSVGGKSSKR